MGCSRVAAARRRNDPRRQPPLGARGSRSVRGGGRGRTTSLLAPMVSLARGHSLREAGVFSFESLSTDFILATLGLAVAAFWHLNPWLIPFARRAAAADPPLAGDPAAAGRGACRPEDGPLQRPATSLCDARRSSERAQRFQRPMALIMADLDLLRDINNTYGHLAGDAVLARRRGGLPRSSCATTTSRPASAARSSRSSCPRRLRSRRSKSRTGSAARSPRASSRSRPRASRSAPPFRWASPPFPRDGQDATELVHQADLAVYRAKLQGRNRVLDASDELAARAAG